MELLVALRTLSMADVDYADIVSVVSELRLVAASCRLNRCVAREVCRPHLQTEGGCALQCAEDG